VRSRTLLRAFFALHLIWLLAGCQQKTPTSSRTAADTATRVEVVRPQRKDIRHTVTQPATVHPYHQADIVAKVAGYFEAVYVDIGDEVEEGQPLAKLSIPEMDKQRDQAVARQQRLAAELERATAAAEVAAAQRVAAEAEVEEIDTMLDYATLRAPFAGVVTSRDVDPGDFVSGSPAGGESQRPLFHVDQQHRLRVRVTVPERDAADVDAGDPVVIDCDARPGKPIEAEATRVA